MIDAKLRVGGISRLYRRKGKNDEKMPPKKSRAEIRQPNTTKQQISTARPGILCLGFLGSLQFGNASGAKGRHKVHYEGRIDPLSLFSAVAG